MQFNLFTCWFHLLSFHFITFLHLYSSFMHLVLSPSKSCAGTPRTGISAFGALVGWIEWTTQSTFCHLISLLKKGFELKTLIYSLDCSLFSRHSIHFCFLFILLFFMFMLLFYQIVCLLSLLRFRTFERLLQPLNLERYLLYEARFLVVVELWQYAADRSQTLRHFIFKGISYLV